MSQWLFTIQLQISLAVIVILLLRQAMKKLPKIYSYLLWLLVFARLLVPVSVETRFSFMPSEQEQEAFVADVLENFGEDSVTAEMPGVPGENSKPAEVTGTLAGDPVNAEVAGNTDTDFVGSQVGSSEPNAGVGVQNAGNNVVSGIGASGMAGSTAGDEKPGAEGSMSEGHAQGNENVAGSTGSSEEINSDVLQDVAKPSGMMWIWIAVWAVGTTAVLGYNGLALRKVRQRLQNARCLVDHIQIGAGKAPVYVSDKINTPFSLGLFRPVVYLPMGLNAEEQEYILCHERVHISRKDNLVKHVTFLLTAVYWFNPFVWVAFFFMERDMEMSCDEKVLKLMGGNIKRDYSQSLLNFAAGRGKMPATHLTFGENSVKQRVKNVLSYKNAKKWSIAVGAVVLMVVVVALFTSGQNESEQVDVKGDQVIADGGDDQVMADSQGSSAQGEENQGGSIDDNSDKDGNQGDSMGNSGGNQAGDGNGQGVENSGEGNQNADNGDAGQNQPEDGTGNSGDEGTESIYLSLTTEEALIDHCERFVRENTNVSYYDYDYDKQTDKAVIRYYVKDSLWEQYVLLESVKIAEEKELYHVVQESLADCSIIETNDQFEALYGAPGFQNLKLLRYGTDYYRSILQQLHTNGPDESYCVKFLDPVTAAVEMLNLGEGSGVAKLEDGSIISGGAQGMAVLDAVFTEGTYAYVTYIFAKDGSQVEIPVRLIEGSYGLWSVDADAVREVYATEDFRYYNSGPGYDLEFTEYGIYRNSDGILTNIYPYHISPNVVWDEADGIIYFPTDAFYQEGYFDYSENTICMLDYKTGEFDKETLSLESLPVSRGPIIGINAEAGLLTVNCRATVASNTSYTMPLINTGNTALATGYTYKGKAVKDLTAEERDAYSVELRNVILKKGEVMKFSNRTMKETYAYVDLDGDGKAEKITLLPSTTTRDYGYVSRDYDNFRLQVGDSIVSGKRDKLENELWFFSFDGESIVIALYSAGFSDDYTTELYVYKDGVLRNVGTVESRIDDLTLDPAKGILHVEDAYHRFMQPVWIRRDWVLNEDGQMEEIPKDTYEIVMGRTILPDLLVALPVHESPGSEKVTYIQPQKVNFLRFNSTFDWVYIWAADGSSGWFQIEVVSQEQGISVLIPELDMHHNEVFTLYYAG